LSKLSKNDFKIKKAFLLKTELLGHS